MVTDEYTVPQYILNELKQKNWEKANSIFRDTGVYVSEGNSKRKQKVISEIR